MNDTTNIYDVFILGGGVAGLTCAIYSVRYNLKTIVVSADFGGQILQTGEIENWPGNIKITGPQLSDNFYNHAKELGATLLSSYVKSIVKKVSSEVPVDFKDSLSGVSEYFEITLDSTETPVIYSKTVVIAAGANHRKLGIPGEAEFAGRGVSYCCTCDGPFFRNKTVVVVGGGDAGVTGAYDLSRYAKKIYLIHRSGEFKAKPAYIDLIKKTSNIEIILNTNVVSALGSGKLEKVMLDKDVNGSKELVTDGLFVEVGFKPSSDLALKLGVAVDEFGYIKVEANQSTSVKGVFAAGDITTASNKFSQLVTAASEGAIASEGVFHFLRA